MRKPKVHKRESRRILDTPRQKTMWLRNKDHMLACYEMQDRELPETGMITAKERRVWSKVERKLA